MSTANLKQIYKIPILPFAKKAFTHSLSLKHQRQKGITFWDPPSTSNLRGTSGPRLLAVHPVWSLSQPSICRLTIFLHFCIGRRSSDPLTINKLGTDSTNQVPPLRRRLVPSGCRIDDALFSDALGLYVNARAAQREVNN